MKRKAGLSRGKRVTIKPLQDLPFSERVVLDPELTAARRAHAGMSEAERLEAAQWSYDAGMGDFLWGQMMAGMEGGTTKEPQLPSGYLSLAIEPRFAPGLLTVGSIEYQLGRKEEAMNYKILNDVGWSLVLLKRFDEARTILEKAVALSPPDYEFPRNNLKELAKAQRKSARKPRGAGS